MTRGEQECPAIGDITLQHGVGFGRLGCGSTATPAPFPDAVLARLMSTTSSRPAMAALTRSPTLARSGASHDNQIKEDVTGKRRSDGKLLGSVRKLPNQLWESEIWVCNHTIIPNVVLLIDVEPIRERFSTVAPFLAIVVTPRFPSSAKAIARIVFKALPCCPRVRET
jgi:hypothetical protein